jgi:hypothetical protein
MTSNRIKFIGYFLVLMLTGCCECTRQRLCPDNITNSDRAKMPYKQGDSLSFINQEKSKKAYFYVYLTNEGRSDRGAIDFYSTLDCSTWECYNFLKVSSLFGYKVINSSTSDSTYVDSISTGISIEYIFNKKESFYSIFLNDCPLKKDSIYERLTIKTKEFENVQLFIKNDTFRFQDCYKLKKIYFSSKDGIIRVVDLNNEVYDKF